MYAVYKQPANMSKRKRQSPAKSKRKLNAIEAFALVAAETDLRDPLTRFQQTRPDVTISRRAQQAIASPVAYTQWPVEVLNTFVDGHLSLKLETNIPRASYVAKDIPRADDIALPRPQSAPTTLTRTGAPVAIDGDTGATFYKPSILAAIEQQIVHDAAEYRARSEGEGPTAGPARKRYDLDLDDLAMATMESDTDTVRDVIRMQLRVIEAKLPKRVVSSSNVVHVRPASSVVTTDDEEEDNGEFQYLTIDDVPVGDVDVMVLPESRDRISSINAMFGVEPSALTRRRSLARRASTASTFGFDVEDDLLEEEQLQVAQEEQQAAATAVAVDASASSSGDMSGAIHDARRKVLQTRMASTHDDRDAGEGDASKRLLETRRISSTDVDAMTSRPTTAEAGEEDDALGFGFDFGDAFFETMFLQEPAKTPRESMQLQRMSRLSSRSVLVPKLVGEEVQLVSPVDSAQQSKLQQPTHSTPTTASALAGSAGVEAIVERSGPVDGKAIEVDAQSLLSFSSDSDLSSRADSPSPGLNDSVVSTTVVLHGDGGAHHNATADAGAADEFADEAFGFTDDEPVGTASTLPAQLEKLVLDLNDAETRDEEQEYVRDIIEFLTSHHSLIQEAIALGLVVTLHDLAHQEDDKVLQGDAIECMGVLATELFGTLELNDLGCIKTLNIHVDRDATREPAVATLLTIAHSSPDLLVLTGTLPKFATQLEFMAEGTQQQVIEFLHSCRSLHSAGLFKAQTHKYLLNYLGNHLDADDQIVALVIETLESINSHVPGGMDSFLHEQSTRSTLTLLKDRTIVAARVATLLQS
eukprot:m.193349 g.193349  ORF g.193349 m.193349 type:complete len:813 (+) comp14879_c0_seq2:80-2518(+)